MEYATLSAPRGAKIRVESVAALRDLPQPDLTGDGYPDVWFETAFDGHRCCQGTLVYSLSPVPGKALESSSPPPCAFSRLALYLRHTRSGEQPVPTIATITATDPSLPADVAARYGIRQVPINLHFGAETLHTCADIDDAGLLARVDR